MKQMEKTAARRLLAGALVCALSTSPVLAAEAAGETAKTPSEFTGSFSSFTQKQTWTDGKFLDVTTKDWFAEGVRNVYRLGLMNGSSADAFNPAGNIKLCEAISMAAKLRNIYGGGTGALPDSGADLHWYDDAVVYALEQGILKGEEFSNYEAYATRAQLAMLFARALPSDALTAVNAVSSVPDVTGSTPYAEEILRLYRAGIVSGIDAAGNFSPKSEITRGEAASILWKTATPAERSSFVLNREMGLPLHEDGQKTFTLSAGDRWSQPTPAKDAESRLSLVLTDQTADDKKTAKKDTVTLGEITSFVSLKTDAAAPLAIFHDLTAASLTKELGGRQLTAPVEITLSDGSCGYLSPLASGDAEDAVYWLLTAEGDSHYVTLIGRAKAARTQDTEDQILSVMKSLKLTDRSAN